MNYSYKITIEIESPDFIDVEEFREMLAGAVTMEMVDNCDSISVGVTRTDLGDEDEEDEEEDDFDEEDDLNYDPDEDPDLDDEEEDEPPTVPASVTALMRSIVSIANDRRNASSQDEIRRCDARAKSRISNEGDAYLESGWALYCEQAGIVQNGV